MLQLMAEEPLEGHALADVVAAFDLQHSVHSIVPIAGGHINDTYRLFGHGYHAPDYLMQRINHDVFRDVDGMMRNIHLVTGHLRHKWKRDPRMETLQIFPSKNGALYVQDTSRNYWRVYDYKKRVHSYQVVETTSQAYEGAKAFGLFLSGLADFQVTQLIKTIPDFHNIMRRLALLKLAVEAFPGERVTEVSSELVFVAAHADRMCQIEEKKIKGEIPVRVTHNDTKFNNVLLDASGRGICVVDLDTVMPGIVHYDFGDGVRTSTNTAPEDAQDLSRVHFDFEKFKAFATGYLEATQGMLIADEVVLLGLSGPLFSYLMGVRFLTDYISQDKYYKTSYPGHNLVRARVQFELTKQMMARLDTMHQFVCKEAGVNA